MNTTANTHRAFALDCFITTSQVPASEMPKFSRVLRKHLEGCAEIETFYFARCKPFGSIYLQTTLAYEPHLARENANLANAMEECVHASLESFATA